jgi:anti-sigma factor RsiW
MLTCETAEVLVMKEVDGLLTEAERAEIEAHTGGCAACRTRREAHLTVSSALSRRLDAPVPDGFARRVSARVSPAASDGWLETVDWRRWTEWMLPVAAALVLVAALAGGNGATASSASQAPSAVATAQAIEAWAWSAGSDGTDGAEALRQDVSDEELLETMLGARVARAEGNGNGR